MRQVDFPSLIAQHVWIPKDKSEEIRNDFPTWTFQRGTNGNLPFDQKEGEKLNSRTIKSIQQYLDQWGNGASQTDR